MFYKNRRLLVILLVMLIDLAFGQTISTAEYDASTGTLTITGADFVSNDSGADIDVSLLSITGGESGSKYTLTNTADVEISSATQVIIVLSSEDQLNVNGLLNKNGFISAGATTYNLAAADNWMTGSPEENNTEDLIGNGIEVLNVLIPTITSAEYNVENRLFIITGTNFFKRPGLANDVDLSIITVTGGTADETYTLTATVDVEINSSTEFSFTLSEDDKTKIDLLLDKRGTVSYGGSTYNIVFGDNWLTAADNNTDISDETGNGITVSINPKIDSAIYNYATGTFVVSGTNIKFNESGSDIDASKITVTGEGNETCALTNTPDVEIDSDIQFTLVLSPEDKSAVNLILNKNGSISTGGSIYNIAAADDWNIAIADGNSEDKLNNGVIASNVISPTITSASYNAGTGVLVVTATDLKKYKENNNDIIANNFIVVGEGGETYKLASSSDVDISSGTEFTINLSLNDRINLNTILNKNGTSSTGGANYNLEVSDDWNRGTDTTLNFEDITGNSITVSNVGIPEISSASYVFSNGTLIVSGSNFVKLNGAANDIDVSKFTFTGEGSGTYTLSNSNNVDITSGTQFTVLLSADDKTEINKLLNKDGTLSKDNTTYNLAAQEDWALGSVASVNVADLTNGITVSNTNLVPTGGDGEISVNEDQVYTFSKTDFPFSDAGGDTLIGISVVGNVDKGFLKFNGIDIAIPDTIKDFSKLTYLPESNSYGSPYTSFNFKVIDNQNTFSTADYKLIINVISISDTPKVVVNKGFTVNEGDSILISSEMLRAEDSDNGDDSLKFVIKQNPKYGYFKLEENKTSEFTQKDILENKVKFIHDGSETLIDSLYFIVRDPGGTQSADSLIVITINPVNDAPTADFTEVNINEGESFLITPLNFTLKDADSNLDSLRITIIEGPTEGKVTLNEIETTSFRNKDIMESRVKYYHNGGESVLDSFKFNVRDTKDSVSADYIFTIGIEGVNDPPRFLEIPSLGYEEDKFQILTFDNLLNWVDDPDSKQNNKVTVFLNSISSKINIVSTNNGYVLRSPENWYGNGEIQFIASDGLVTIDTLLNVEVKSVNDLPVISGIPSYIKFKNGGKSIISFADAFSDVETPDSLLKIEFNSEPDSLQPVFDKNTSLLTLTAKGSYFGEAELEVILSDTDGGKFSDYIDVTVEENTTGITKLDGIPDTYILEQNYPNPFNPTTIIKYGLPEEEFVSVKIYDIIGREVYSQEDIHQAGYYEFKWDASQLSSGIYIYRLTGKNVNITKKMMLIK